MFCSEFWAYLFIRNLVYKFLCWHSVDSMLIDLNLGKVINFWHYRWRCRRGGIERSHHCIKHDKRSTSKLAHTNLSSLLSERSFVTRSALADSTHSDFLVAEYSLAKVARIPSLATLCCVKPCQCLYQYWWVWNTAEEDAFNTLTADYELSRQDWCTTCHQYELSRSLTKITCNRLIDWQSL